MGKKLTNEDIDKKLEGRNIKRVGDYAGNKFPILFQCLKCNNEWKTTPKSIFNGSYCPKCEKEKNGLTNEIVDQRLKNRNIKRIGNYITNKISILFKCLICDEEWKAAPSDILKGTGCPECAKANKLTNEIVDERLKNKNIKRIDNYINSKTAITFKCLICNNEWDISPSSIFTGGCPKCAGLLKLTDEIVDDRLKNRNIERISNYINSRTNIIFKCLFCNNEWKTNPNSILTRETGCPKCNIPGINEKLVFSLLKQNHIDFYHDYNIKNINFNASYNYRVDFYIPNYNLIIEYNGLQHYKPGNFGSRNIEENNKLFIKQQKRDLYIDYFCQENEIDIIWIDGREYYGNKLKNFVENVILPMIK